VRAGHPAAESSPSAATRPGQSDGLSEGVTLSLSSAIGSVAGLLGWIVATRLEEPNQVGEAAQLVAAFILISGATQLNLGVGLLRWIPAAGRYTSRLVWSSLLLILPLGALVGLGYVFLVPAIGRTAAGDGPFGLGVVLFVSAAAGWTVFVVHDYILVAVGKPWWAVWRNAVFSAVRLSLLIVLCLAGLGAQGIVLSWVAPIVVWIVVGSLALAVMTRSISRRAREGTLPTARAAAAFLAPTAVAQLSNSLLYNEVTVMVTDRFGDETGAKFFMVWQAVTVVDLSVTFFMNSLAVGVAREPGRAAELAATARRRLVLIYLPVLAFGCVVASPVLDLVFGSAYAEAADILRLLLVGLAIRLVVLHELGVRQAIGRAFAYARLQLISTIAVIVVVAVVPVGAGDVAALLPVAFGYVAVQVVCAAAVLLSPARRRPADVEVVSP
jgi:O-antigen/teichoic acid export membrane protein